MKTIKLLSLYLMLAMLLPGYALAAYNGTPAEPNEVDGCYQIGTAEELYGFAQLVNDGSINGECCVKLTADIVVNENVLDAKGKLKAGSFTP